jgi:Tfp pilus assembly protein PilF
MFPRFLLALVLVLSCCSLAFAQKPGGGGGGNTGGGGGNTGGGNTGGGNSGQPSFNSIPNFPGSMSQGSDLQVRLAWPNERSIEQSVHIQLLNATSVPVQDTFSRPDGTVSFRSVPAGTYRLRIDGPDIKDMVTDAFVIYPQERMHMEWVHVMPKEEAQKNIPGGAPTISASELNVPSKAKSEMEKGMEAFSKGDLKKADERLEKAIEIYPKFARAWNNLGVVRMKENNKEGAREAFQKSIEADDKLTSGYMNLARLSMMDNNMPEAMSYITKGLTADPNNVEGLTLLAREQLLMKQYDKALITAHKVHGLPHDHLADIHLIAGEALLHQNHSTEAIQEYELYLKEYPDSPNAAKVRTAMAQIQAKQTKTD